MSEPAIRQERVTAIVDYTIKSLERLVPPGRLSADPEYLRQFDALTADEVGAAAAALYAWGDEQARKAGLPPPRTVQ